MRRPLPVATLARRCPFVWQCAARLKIRHLQTGVRVRVDTVVSAAAARGPFGWPGLRGQRGRSKVLCVDQTSFFAVGVVGEVVWAR